MSLSRVFTKNDPYIYGLMNRTNKSSSTCVPNMSILACMVVEKSLTQNFNLQSMEGKKLGQMQERISWRRLVLNPMIQVVINLRTKYELSSLHGCGEIFDEKFHSSKYGRKEKRTNTGKNRQEKPGSQSHNTTSRHQPAYH